MYRTEKKYELIVLIILVVITGILLITASIEGRAVTDGIGSMEFPKYVFLMAIALCLVVMVPNIKTLLNKENRSKIKEVFIDKRVGISIALIFIYAILWQVIGFFLSSILYFSMQAKILDKEKSNIRIIIVGTCFAALMYGVFGFAFDVSFPEPLMELFLN